jgi:hypothetical protein
MIYFKSTFECSREGSVASFSCCFTQASWMWFLYIMFSTSWSVLGRHVHVDYIMLPRFVSTPVRSKEFDILSKFRLCITKNSFQCSSASVLLSTSIWVFMLYYLYLMVCSTSMLLTVKFRVVIKCLLFLYCCFSFSYCRICWRSIWRNGLSKSYPACTQITIPSRDHCKN